MVCPSFGDFLSIFWVCIAIAMVVLPVAVLVVIAIVRFVVHHDHHTHQLCLKQKGSIVLPRPTNVAS